MLHYRSSIPEKATERAIATFLKSPAKYKAEHRLKGALVGVRFFFETGELQGERPLRDGKTHGMVYRCDVPGRVLSREPYRDGLPHGVARQWDNDGTLIGSWKMKRGTGWDLWRCAGEGGVHLTEAGEMKAGNLHGFEWWLNEDHRSVHAEAHFWLGQRHGIERSWNAKGRLRRGYPRYYVRQQRVDKKNYLKARLNDPALPPFRVEDNLPARRFPAEVRDAIRATRSMNFR